MKNNSFRFTAAVVMESIITVAVSLVYSSVTGAISKSSLAAASVGNQAITLIVTIMNVLVCGATLLTAWNIGRGNREAAGRVAENALFCTPLISVIIMAVLLVASPLVMRLLMPNAEESFLEEGTLYFRIVLWSLPFLMLLNVSGGMLRAAGDSRSPMLAVVVSCVVQLITIWLMTDKWHMGILAPALSTLICRIASSAFLVYVLLRHNRVYTVRLRNVFKPDFELIKRMCALGLPNTFDGLAVQAGYVGVNSMLVAMGTTQAGVVNVLIAVFVFTGICQGIGSNITTMFAGQRVGAGQINEARKVSLTILGVTEAVSFILTIPVLLFPGFTAGLFTSDPEILAQSTKYMWLLLPLVFVAVGCNVMEPAVRAAGDVKFIMTEIVCCVLLIRVPLTYLMCFVWNMGVPGVYFANVISLFVRCVFAFTRIVGPKFGRNHS